MNNEDKPKLKQNDSQPLLTGQAKSKSRLYQKDTNFKKNCQPCKKSHNNLYSRFANTRLPKELMPTSATLICYDRYFLHHSCNFLKISQPNMQSLWGSLDNTATEILPFRKEEQSLEQLWVRSFAGDSATQLRKWIKFKGSSASCCSHYGTHFAPYVTPALRAPAGQFVTQPSVAMQVVSYWLLLQCLRN